MMTQTKSTQDRMTTEYALQILKEGNWNFEQNKRTLRDFRNQRIETKEGQYPFAAVLSCIDSRVPAEMIFDQGIGDLFSVRVAGNIVNEDILGSLEYSCKVAGSKLIVVLGHTKCGAVTAACKNVEMGNITPLLKKITAANDIIGSNKENITDHNIELVAIENVKTSIEKIKAESEILQKMEENSEIIIVGAIYDVAKGRVTFL